MPYRDPSDPLECLDNNRPRDPCKGTIEYRMALSATGKSFPRCDHHWDKRLDQQEETDARYPMFAPSDWSPLDAGEHWDSDY